MLRFDHSAQQMPCWELSLCAAAFEPRGFGAEEELVGGEESGSSSFKQSDRFEVSAEKHGWEETPG